MAVSESAQVRAPRTRRRVRALSIARWLVTAAVVIGAVWLFRHVNVPLLGATLARADLRLLALAITINLTINLYARASRWRSLLPPSERTGRRPPKRELARVLLAAQAALNVFPFRAGEAVRVLELQRRYGYPATALVTWGLAEKVVEFVTISLYLIPVVALLPGATAWLNPRSLLVALGAALAVCVVAVTLLRATARAAGSVGARLAGHAGAIARTLERPRTWARAAAWSILSDAADVTMILVCLRAVGVHQPIAAGCAILLSINVAIAIPSTPAQLGVFEAGAVFALVRLGVRPDTAAAFALLYHATHVIPTTLLGGALLLLGGGKPRRGSSALAPRPSVASGIDRPSP